MSMSPDDFLRTLERDLGRPSGSLEWETDLRGVSSWDSMAVLMVISLVDIEFGKTVTGAEVRASATPRALYERVLSAPPASEGFSS